MRPIYITGHKNPDTDSIVSSIAYANIKNQKGISAIASRIGPINPDTEYLLNKFGFDDPLHIYTAKSTVREINFDKAVLIDKETSIKEAYDKLNKVETRTIFVADKQRNLFGLVTLSNISSIWFANKKEAIKILKQADFKTITKVLKAKAIVKPNNFNINGEIIVSPIDNAKIEEGTIIVTSNIKKINNVIKEKAGLIVALDGTKLDDKTIESASKYDVPIISSSLDALNVSKLIYMTAPVKAIVSPVDNIISIKDSMTTDQAISIVSNSRSRSFPIIDGHNKIIGSLSRYHLFNFKKKQLILVDHNEKKQSIDDIEYGEIVEIVDHHRLGGFESEQPINIKTQIVGATATIIANMYFEENLKLDKKMAGLLLGAIVADTLNFKSPTTTDKDKETAKKLEKISGEKADDLSNGMIASSASLANKRIKNICYDDFKEFDIQGVKLGLAQAVCKSYEEYQGIADKLQDYIDEIIVTASYDLFVLMLTDPFGSGSYLVYSGKKKSLIRECYPKITERHFVNHLISRKKQLLPDLIKAIEK